MTVQKPVCRLCGRRGGHYAECPTVTKRIDPNYATRCGRRWCIGCRVCGVALFFDFKPENPKCCDLHAQGSEHSDAEVAKVRMSEG